MAYNYVSFALKPTDVIGFSDDQRTAVELQVTFSIYDEATWLYRNFKFPRFENFYGYAQLMSGAYVIKSVPLQFINQEILYQEYDTFDINDNAVCIARVILANLTPPKENVFAAVTLHRSRITSIRFRLLGGIGANIGIRWITPESNCGNAIRKPDPKQGNPIAPNNSGGGGGSRPGDQGGDPFDPSNNDGDYKPDDGNPQPPTPGGNHATWKMDYSGYDTQGQAYHGTLDTLVGDPTAVITFTRTAQGEIGGHTNFAATVFSNGVALPFTPTGGDFTFTRITFY